MKRKTKLVVVTIIMLMIIPITNFAYDNSPQIEICQSNRIETTSELVLPVAIKLEEPKINMVNMDERLEKEVGNKYDIRNEVLDINVKNQGLNAWCWACATNSSIELNLLKKKGIKYCLKDEYLEDATVEKYCRVKNEGGNSVLALDYYMSGNNIVDATNKVTDLEVEDFIMFPTIYKSIRDGKVECQDGAGTKYTVQQVKEIRNLIKNHIKENGAVTATVYMSADAIRYFSDVKNPINSEAYYCDYSYNSFINLIDVNHLVTIIGWDDNYPVENFNEGHRPTSPGAYLVLNSWGKEFSADGVVYVSYEDCFIESCTIGVKNVDKKDQEIIYQNDELGISNIISPSGANYGANIFTRSNPQKAELLKEVSVGNLVNSAYEIYVNPEGEDLSFDKLIKVATTENLQTGYHTIQLDKEIILTGKKFAVVVKYINNIGGNNPTMGVEYSYSYWKNAKNAPGQSYVYLNGKWVDLYSVEDKNIKNLCIKAYTSEYIDKIAPEISGVTFSENNWTNKDIILTVNGAKDNYSGLAKEAYSFDGGKTWQSSNSKTYTQNENGIIIKVKDKNDNMYTHESLNITKIDKILPTIQVNKLDEGDTVAIIEFAANDTQSGIKSVKIGDEEIELVDNKYTYKTSINGKYTIEVIDNATNKFETNFIVKSIKLLFSSNVYTIEPNNISKIQPNTTIEEFKRNINTNAEIIVANESAKYIGTGMIIKLKFANNEVEYKALVVGDVDGDGTSNFNDILLINKHRLKRVILEEIYAQVGDINNDGATDFTDMLQINKYRLNRITSL